MVNKNKLKRINILSSPFRDLLIILIAIIISIIIFSILIALLKYNVTKALLTLVETSFGSFFGFRSTIIKMIPLVFLAYAFAIPSMVRFYNIGGYGQMMFGATVITIFAFLFKNFNISSYILIPFLLLIGFCSGGLFATIASFLKIKGDIDPIISTIMLNFVSLEFLHYITQNPLFADPIAGHPTTKILPQNSLMGTWYGIPHSIVILVITIIFIYYFVRKFKIGYEILATGYNINAAERFGINIKSALIWSFFIGGGIAGLSGTLEIININNRLISGFASTNGAQYGLFGALTALIVGKMSPIGIPIAAFFMSILLVGANALQRTMGISVFIVFILQAIMVINIVVIRTIFNKRR